MFFTTRIITASVALLAFAIRAASQTLNMHNWCDEEVSFLVSTQASCDFGSTGICQQSPWTIPSNQVLLSPLSAYPTATSIKITWSPPPTDGVLQFEYTLSDSLYWDLSDIDGSSPAVVGSPFYNENVKLSPTGDGAGVSPCMVIVCPPGTLCQEAYNESDDVATKTCPAGTDFVLDLCEPSLASESKRAETLADAMNLPWHGGDRFHGEPIRP